MMRRGKKVMNDTATQLKFQNCGRKEVIGDFNGGIISTDGGSLLLGEIEKKLGIINKFANCFDDKRNPNRIEHTVPELLAQRINGICLGYQDLNDHDKLRHDSLLAIACGKNDPLGLNRQRETDKGKALAGKSTLNRLELTPEEVGDDERYKKIIFFDEKIETFFVTTFLDLTEKEPDEIVLDVDATDDPLFGDQEGKYYNGYYDCYCYLPLYIFCNNHLLYAKQKSSSLDASYGTVDALKMIIREIRKRWKNVKILVRGDSGFCRDEIMKWCEKTWGVDFIFGLGRNSRLLKSMKNEIREVENDYKKTNETCRRFIDFNYRTRKTWSKTRRVIGKAEHSEKGSNPRFLVTSLKRTRIVEGKRLYENIYCARCDMENRIKEKQLYLFADTTPCKKLRENQLRLWLASVAYVLMHSLRIFGLAGLEWSKFQCETIRNKVLKIGALVKISVRRIYIQFSSNYPYQSLFYKVLYNIRQISLSPG